MLPESKITEVAIDQIRSLVEPSKAEQLAAFEPFVESRPSTSVLQIGGTEEATTA